MLILRHISFSYRSVPGDEVLSQGVLPDGYHAPEHLPEQDPPRQQAGRSPAVEHQDRQADLCFPGLEQCGHGV